MGHIEVPEYLGPISASCFGPPMMRPHIIPGQGIIAVPHPQFTTPLRPVPIIPFHEPWVGN